MSDRDPIHSPLKGRSVAVPESRQLDVLAALFERRLARVLRVPLVSIHDAPDQAPVLHWLRHFVQTPPDLLVLLTGEGLRRLHAAARRNDLEEAFISALARVTTICRGPKPGRALKEMQLNAGLVALEPTTAGVIATLESMSLTGKRVAVQLYGEDPNTLLMSFLERQSLLECSSVAPYVYGNDSDADAVAGLIEAMGAGEIDLIAFTSKPQLRRLFEVAMARGLEQRLDSGWSKVLVAAVGPVLAAELAEHGVDVQIMPAGAYFMKPLVRAAEKAFSALESESPSG